jgi:type III secretory pathway lipoprotein EscJ
MSHFLNLNPEQQLIIVTCVESAVDGSTDISVITSKIKSLLGDSVAGCSSDNLKVIKSLENLTILVRVKH